LLTTVLTFCIVSGILVLTSCGIYREMALSELRKPLPEHLRVVGEPHPAKTCGLGSDRRHDLSRLGCQSLNRTPPMRDDCRPLLDCHAFAFLSFEALTGQGRLGGLVFATLAQTEYEGMSAPSTDPGDDRWIARVDMRRHNVVALAAGRARPGLSFGIAMELHPRQDGCRRRRRGRAGGAGNRQARQLAPLAPGTHRLGMVVATQLARWPRIERTGAASAAPL
jgi:hypothetical protein